ncbi:hypothetical protein ACFVAG_19280 [Streptomyces sp. NPDC057644]|uniref:hypothetical protein n=1 Tax=Streptomyces sp. NPDC057644 TaxID=3346191 RepID=UPI003691EB10
MSPGDEHDYRGKDQGSRPDDPYSTLGGTRQTRTRLPDGDPGHPGARRPARNSRSLVTITGIVVLLVAAIAFANRGGGSEDDASPGAKTSGSAGSAPTAATGTKPVQGKNGTIASGFAQDEQGAQSAAANYAVALGSAEMFNQEQRRDIVQSLADSSTATKLQSGFDADYSQGFLEQIGLETDGSAPAGSTFVNRTLPAGTKVKSYSSSTAEIEVWCSGLFGLTGEKSTKPVTSGWFTVTMQLKWNGSDWKILETSQRSGPSPVTGDNPVSGSDEIADAVNQFGGFTYAR